MSNIETEKYVGKYLIKMGCIQTLDISIFVEPFMISEGLQSFTEEATLITIVPTGLDMLGLNMLKHVGLSETLMTTR